MIAAHHRKNWFYTIGDKSIYLYDLRRMDEIMEALDNRSSMDWCVAVMMIAMPDLMKRFYSPHQLKVQQG